MEVMLHLLRAGTYTFHLKANKNMKFTGVPVGTTITVKESAAKNYKGSAEITINGTKLTSVAETSYNTELTAVRSQKLGQKQNIVDVTNTYNDVPVTGIIMNTLPYVLMIALCGVALIAFVGFKRRKITEIIKYSNQERGCVRRCSAASLFANFASKLVR